LNRVDELNVVQVNGCGIWKHHQQEIWRNNTLHDSNINTLSINLGASRGAAIFSDSEIGWQNRIYPTDATPYRIDVLREHGIIRRDENVSDILMDQQRAREIRDQLNAANIIW